MKILLDRGKKIILLRWLKRGYIDTLDLPEAYRDGSLFYEFLKETGTIDCDEDKNDNKTASTDEADKKHEHNGEVKSSFSG